jgi:hypothetical protein
MAAQPLRAAIAAFGFDGLEHVRHLAGAVPGSSENLRAQDVRLRFVLAAVLQEGCPETELRSLRNDRARSASNDRSGYLTKH